MTEALSPEDKALIESVGHHVPTDPLEALTYARLLSAAREQGRQSVLPEHLEYGAETSLAECPIGLFRFGDELCLKTEYRTERGAVEAYIVSSGEFFWGDRPQTVKSQLAQAVTPVSLVLATLKALQQKEGGDRV